MFKVVLCVCAGSFATAGAQQVLDLKTAVRTALEQHPLLAAGSARILSAEGIRAQAALRPNPLLTFQMENWRFRGSPEFQPGRDVDTFLYASQLLETASKRRLRTEAAAAAVRRSELDRELAGKQVAARVKTAYWAAAGAQRVADLLNENVGTFDQIVRYHELRVREGAMAEADLLKVRLERERVAVAATSAELDAQRARIELLRQMGASEFPPIRLADPVVPMPEAPSVDEAGALAQRTEIKLAAQAIEQAFANLRFEQAMGKPDVEVMGGYKHTAGVNTVIGSVQIPLPFGNRNQGNIASARAIVRAAESEAAAMRAVVMAEVRAAAAEVETRRRQLTVLLPVIVRDANESSEISQAAYREGGSDLLRFLDTERVRIEIQVMYYRTLAEYRQSIAALETAMGVAP
jgi:cobalt-zinc-cadmium efflux system outer membrane protein